MTSNEGFIFMTMVFVAVVLLASAMIVPTAGSAAQASRKMRKRIGRHLDLQEAGTTSLLRDQYLKDLSPLERSIEGLPLVESLSHMVEQSGVRTSAAKVVMKGFTYGIIAAAVLLIYPGIFMIALVGAFTGFLLPIVAILRTRAKRLARFEEQLPEALDIMARALQAGHPFNETMNLVAEEMDDPIAGEFGRIFSDLNFGLPLKTAFQGILTRVPSVSLHTLITAVLIQHESGGRLAEILQKVAVVIRGRFKLQRKLKTLSAEGRMSAWILALIPFVLSAMMMIVAPDYLPVLLSDPIGLKLIGGAFALMCIGVFWIRKVIRIQV